MRFSGTRRGRTGWNVARGLILVCALVVMSRGRVRGQEQPTNPAEAAGQTAGKELPDAPGETKKESATPAQAVEDKTKEALDITKDVAQVGFVRARDWESTWITGVFIGKNEPLVSPTTKQREEIYLRQTLTTPGAYMKRAFGALIDQARGTPSQWDDGWGGYAERFASREGQFITANSLAALGNAKLGYEVRYDRCRCRGLWPRTRHAIIRNLLTYDRSEEHLRPQLALYGGAFAGGLVATSWKPRNQSALSNGGYAVLGQLGYGTLLNFVTEFAKEINAKQGVK